MEKILDVVILVSREIQKKVPMMDEPAMTIAAQVVLAETLIELFAKPVVHYQSPSDELKDWNHALNGNAKVTRKKV